MNGEREVARVALPLPVMALAEITEVLAGVHGEGLAFRSVDSTTVAFVVPDGES